MMQRQGLQVMMLRFVEPSRQTIRLAVSEVRRPSLTAAVDAEFGWPAKEVAGLG